jgi:hypothetical protein
MLTDAQIIRLLDTTGHLRRPFGTPDQGPWPITELDHLTLEVAEVREAVKSYQAMYATQLEPLIATHHPQRQSAAVIVDGEIGPAMLDLLNQPRCRCPDYMMGPEQLVGSGNWKGCHGIGDFHAAIVRVANALPPFLTPHFGAIWQRVVQSYEEIGLRFVRDDTSARPNIDISFVEPDGGWIGLAIVGQNETCATKIWARFDKDYRPANIVSEWTTLIRHELGHNCGLGHSQGGCMNSYIVAGLLPTWRGDPSYPLLAKRYGGQPVPGSHPENRPLVICRKNADGTYEEVMTVEGPISGPFPS